MDRKAKGEFVKDKDLQKHRVDIIRLLVTIPNDMTVEVSPPLLHDFADFLSEYANNPTDPAALEINMTFDEVLSRLRRMYIPAVTP